ncbi:MAG: hypothetical protein JSW68_02105, partial [Burkholderiales bacterium]
MSKLLETKISRRALLGRSAAYGAGALALSAFPGLSALAATNELRVLFAGGTWQKWYQETFVDPWV